MIAAVAVPVSGGSWLLARQVLGRNSRLAGSGGVGVRDPGEVLRGPGAWCLSCEWHDSGRRRSPAPWLDGWEMARF